MPTLSLVKKLGLKPQQRILLLHPPAGYWETLGQLPEGIDVSEELNGSYDVVQLFVKDKAELDREAARAIQAVKPDGQLWIAYPKGNSKEKQGLTRDVGWEVVHQAGMDSMSLIAIDDTWSAFRFKRKAGIGGEDVLAAQYAGAKGALRPIYERVVEAAQQFGDDIRLETRNTYVALVRKRQFCTIQPATRTRMDLGLKLGSMPATERLQAASGSGSGSMTYRVVLTAAGEVNDELVAWLRAAYEQSK